MNIKENFYGKLQQIRESSEKLDEISHKKAREAEDEAWSRPVATRVGGRARALPLLDQGGASTCVGRGRSDGVWRGDATSGSVGSSRVSECW